MTGMFNPQGIFPPVYGDTASPPIDSDGTPLVETLMVAYPSPGHMRVARAIRHPGSGRVEFQEQYRTPSPAEVDWLAQRGVTVGAGSMVTGQARRPGFPSLAGDPGPQGPSGDAPAEPEDDEKEPSGGGLLRFGLAVAVGAVGFWVTTRWVVPFAKKKLSMDSDGDEGVDDDDAIEEALEDVSGGED